MPPDVRRAHEQLFGIFADKNQDGIPDIFEGVEGEVHVQSTSASVQKITIDGKTYSSVDEMPSEVRQKYEQMMASIREMLKDANQDGVPDIVGGILAAQSELRPSQATSEPAFATRRPLLESVSPAVTDETPKVWTWLLIFAAVVALLAVGMLVVLLSSH